jgi:hypothetical protein
VSLHRFYTNAKVISDLFVFHPLGNEL